MDSAVLQALQAADIDTSFKKRILGVPIPVDALGRLVPFREQVEVSDGDRLASVRLKTTRELFSGDRRPPDMSRALPREYVYFFAMIERAAADYGVCTKTLFRDKEFEDIYNELRGRPDVRGRHPITQYLQVAIRLYMSLRDVSEAEYEAVLQRLTRSARTFAMGSTSANYTESVLSPLVDPGS